LVGYYRYFSSNWAFLKLFGSLGGQSPNVSSLGAYP
jgi:hypothetical protein